MIPTLTARERQVARLISLGCSTPEIAAVLHIAVATADNHRARVMAKLGTNKAALLTRVALKHRLTTMKDRLTPTEKRRAGRRKDGWN
jgi:two-component system, NarL family, response regulator NreC